jgi:hypothetical protein
VVTSAELEQTEVGRARRLTASIGFSDALFSLTLMLTVQLIFTLWNAAWAAECLPVNSPVLLSGVVEYRYDSPSRRGPFITVLNLREPICVSGLLEGHQNVESFTSFQLGVPASLNRGFRDGDRVLLRGTIGNPAINDPEHRIIFSVEEVR